MTMLIRTFLIIMLLLLVVAGCSSGGGGGGDPVKTVENYLQAKIKGDQETLRGLLCSALEKDVEREASAFATVSGATIEGMACTLDGEVVRCEGKIVAQYGTESTDFPLGAYKVTQEDGEWKWCGETG